MPAESGPAIVDCSAHPHWLRQPAQTGHCGGPRRSARCGGGPSYQRGNGLAGFASFHIPEEALEHFGERSRAEASAQAEWELRFKAYAQEYPDLAAEFQRVIDRQLPKGLGRRSAGISCGGRTDGHPRRFRKTIEILGSRLPEMMGGSADLGPSTHTNIDGAGNFEPENWAGRNMHFGIRENAMGAILNGMALHRGLIPYGGTFLVFSDYMRPPMRLAAMNACR
jgi:transketolase